LRWIIKRVITLLITFYIAITLTFFLIRLMPGNPIDVMINQYMQQGMSMEQARMMVSSLYQIDFSKPAWEQYVEYLQLIFRGNLGISYTYTGVPVIRIISYALPWTVFLLSISISLSFMLGIVLGMFAAYRRNKKSDHAITLFSTITNAIPNYVLALIFLFFFACIWKIFPIRGTRDPRIPPGFTLEFISNIFYHATLPILSFFITTVGSWILQMRGATISVLGEDYIKVAEARGLKGRRIMFSYVGRNAIIPLFTRLAIAIGYMFSGSVLIENIFTYAGIGYYLTYSVTARDYPLMQGCFLITTLAIILSNFIADLLYGFLDPRVRIEK